LPAYLSWLGISGLRGFPSVFSTLGVGISGIGSRPLSNWDWVPQISGRNI
jgi:hypothetical protein